MARHRARRKTPEPIRTIVQTLAKCIGYNCVIPALFAPPRRPYNDHSSPCSCSGQIFLHRSIKSSRRVNTEGKKPSAMGPVQIPAVAKCNREHSPHWPGLLRAAFLAASSLRCFGPGNSCDARYLPMEIDRFGKNNFDATGW